MKRQIVTGRARTETRDFAKCNTWDQIMGKLERTEVRSKLRDDPKVDANSKD